MPHISDYVGDIDWSLPWFLENPDPNVYFERPWVVVDIETTNLEKGSALEPKNRLVCAAWTTSWDREIHYCRGGEWEQHELVEALRRVVDDQGFIVAHNAKFELHWFARMGLDLYNVLTYDTMLGEYVLGGNRWNYAHLSLDKLDKKYGGKGKARIIDAMMKGGVCPSEMPRKLLEARVRQDVRQTANIFRRQRRTLRQQGKLHLAFQRNLLSPCLTWIEQRGIGLDAEAVREAYEASSAELAELNTKLEAFTGGINWKSTQQKAKFLYGRPKHPEAALQYPGLGFPEPTRHGKPWRNKPSKAFPNGAPKTDDAALASLVPKTKRQREFLELLRAAANKHAEVSKTLAFFQGICNEYGEVFYGQFNQAATFTHRLSSSGRKRTFETIRTDKDKPATKSVQFQNFPNKFKSLIKAKREGWWIGESDGSQIEFRAATFVGQDQKALWNIRHDVDQHKLTGSVLLQKAVGEITKEERRLAKPDTFKPLYGGQSGTEAQQRYYAWFRQEYNEIYQTQEGWTMTVLQEKKLRLPWGIEFFWPRTRMSRDGYIDNTPSIFNYPIQNLATAEIVPIAVVFLWHRLHAAGARTELVNTVHDSAIAEVPPDEVSLWHRLSAQCFTMDVYAFLERVYNIEFNVPLGVESSVAPRWAGDGGEAFELNVEFDGEYWFKGDRALDNEQSPALS